MVNVTRHLIVCDGCRKQLHGKWKGILVEHGWIDLCPDCDKDKKKLKKLRAESLRQKDSGRERDG